MPSACSVPAGPCRQRRLHSQLELRCWGPESVGRLKSGAEEALSFSRPDAIWLLSTRADIPFRGSVLFSQGNSVMQSEFTRSANLNSRLQESLMQPLEQYGGRIFIESLIFEGWISRFWSWVAAGGAAPAGVCAFTAVRSACVKAAQRLMGVCCAQSTSTAALEVWPQSDPAVGLDRALAHNGLAGQG